MEGVKSMLRSVLLSVKEGVPATRLQRDYEDIVGESIPFRRLGYGSFEEFIMAVPDVVRIDRRAGEVICHGVHDESTAHIKKLVSKQRSKKVKKPARRPRGGGSARFINHAPRRPPLLHTPMTPRFHPNRHGIPTFIPQPAQKPRTPINISIGNTQSNRGRVIRVGNNQLLNRAMSDANHQRDWRPAPAPKQGASNFEVPPRFRKTQGAGPASTSLQKTSAAARRGPRTEIATISDADSYLESLQLYLRENNQVMQFETTKGGGGFVSFVKVNSETYGSEAIYGTEREAEAAAARRAMQAVKQNTARSTESRLPTIDWNETAYVESGKSSLSKEDLRKLRSRLRELLENKNNGIWNTRIPFMYKEKYNEEPPPDLLDLVKQWTDIARTEPTPRTNREIVYPVQDDQCMYLDIPKTLLVTAGESVTVYMTYISNLGYFFVQREDSVIYEITELLQKHCLTVSAPAQNTLEKGRYCAGIFSGDEQWTRAEIMENKNDGTVELFFVDYGNVESVKAENIRWLSPELAKHPYQSINCCLYGVTTLEGEREWSSASTKMFADMVQDEALTVIPENLCDGILEVQMYVKSQPTQSVGERLATAGVIQTLNEEEEEDSGLHPVDLKLPEDKEWDVHVTYISSSLTSVMLRLVGEEYSEKLDAYQVKLEEAFRNCSSEAPIVEGVTYIAYDDDLFHRVRMISKKDGKVECYFLDHGDTDELLPEQLHPIDPQINKLLPYQAVEVSLYGLEEVATNMTALEQMCELALGKSCVAEIVERDEIPSIILFDTSAEKDLNINDTILALVAKENAPTTTSVEPVTVPESVNTSVAVNNNDSAVKQNGIHTYNDSVNSLNEQMQRTSLVGAGDSVTENVQKQTEYIPKQTDYVKNETNSFSTPQRNTFSAQQQTNTLSMQQTSLSSAQHSSTNNGLNASPPQTSSTQQTAERETSPQGYKIKSSDSITDCALSRPILGRSKSSTEVILHQFVIPDVGQYFDLHVNFVRDPSNFVCIPYDEMDKLNSLLVDMLAYYENDVEKPIAREDVKLGYYYAGPIDMVWFRVKIHSFVGTDLVSVYQVDIGEYSVMMINELRPLKQEFCKLPAMAFNACLGKISPKSGSWFESAKYKFIELALNKDLIGLVVGHDDKNGVVQLRLIDTSTEVDLCVDEVLVKMGFASLVQ